MNRRNFILQCGQFTGALFTPDFLLKKINGWPTDSEIIGLNNQPVIIDSIEIFRVENDFMIQVKSKDGYSGKIPANDKVQNLLGILKDLVIPHFLGKNARELESLTWNVYRVNSNYKYAGMPFWICVAHVELAILDMLGRIDGVPVGRLFDKPIREEFPVYLSTFDRENTAEVYLENVQERIGNFKAVKLKIGGRMSKNQDCIAGRTEKMIPLFRKALGGQLTLYVDANSSYDAEKAIEVGRLLEEYSYGFFEEPCPWQDYEETRKVSDALEIPVAGGEQDSSASQFEYMIRNKVVDIIQPDIMYNGGFLRSLKIAGYARQQGIPITLHSPQQGAANAFKMQFASIVENVGPYQEYNAGKGYDWCSVDIKFNHDKLKIVNKPGWGIDYDEDLLGKAVKI
jgi:L-alanine-DL-glutamate epimerase-like enolase superfamily enzyme